MKHIISLFFLAAVAIAMAVPVDKYKEYDFNIQEVLDNRRLLVSYINCALDETQCKGKKTKVLKVHVKEALETDCARCTERQKADVAVVVKHMVTKEKAYWDKLVAKYDPERKYADALEKKYVEKDTVEEEPAEKEKA